MEKKNEIIVYHPAETLRIEVRLENETVWLTQAQMAELFEKDRSVITKHINNVFKEKEVCEKSNVHFLHIANSDKPVRLYSLDVIISVGYRVKSARGTQFRIWANQVLKEYLLKGFAINQRIDRLEKVVTEHSEKIDFFVRTSLPPVEGIFYDGQLFDAYKFASDLIRSARSSIILIDNYVDETVLMLLTKRAPDVKATIYTAQISKLLSLDLQKHNAQYEPIDVRQFNQSHDRFLVIDQKDVYHIGASLKDLGKKWFAFSLIHLDVQELLQKIEGNLKF